MSRKLIFFFLIFFSISNISFAQQTYINNIDVSSIIKTGDSVTLSIRVKNLTQRTLEKGNVSLKFWIENSKGDKKNLLVKENAENIVLTSTSEISAGEEFTFSKKISIGSKKKWWEWWGIYKLNGVLSINGKEQEKFSISLCVKNKEHPNICNGWKREPPQISRIIKDKVSVKTENTTIQKKTANNVVLKKTSSVVSSEKKKTYFDTFKKQEEPKSIFREIDKKVSGSISLSGYTDKQDDVVKDLWNNKQINGFINYGAGNIRLEALYNKGLGWDQKRINFSLNNEYGSRPYLNLNIGDIYSQVSNMTLGSMSVSNGIQTKVKYKSTSVIGITGRLTDAKDGYYYARNLYGGRLDSELLSGKLKVGVTYAEAKDDEKSVSYALTSPVKSDSLGFDLSYKSLGLLICKSGRCDVSYEYSKSKYTPDMVLKTTKNTGEAHQAQISLQFDRFAYFRNINILSKYQRIDSNFTSLTSPGIINDREGFYNTLNFYFDMDNQFGLSSEYNAYNDNVNDNPDKMTTKTKYISFGTKLKFFNINRTETTNIGENKSLINNKTINYYANANYAIIKNLLTLSLNYNFSQYDDKTNISPDLKNNTYGIGLSGKSYGISYSTSKLKEETTGKVTNTKNFNLNKTITPIPNKLYFYTYYSTMKSNDNIGTVDNYNQSININANYLINSSFTATLGYQYRTYKDNLLKTKNNEYIINTGLTWKF